MALPAAPAYRGMSTPVASPYCKSVPADATKLIVALPLRGSYSASPTASPVSAAAARTTAPTTSTRLAMGPSAAASAGADERSRFT
jgi:hypothetical protein